ncbi:hypothetical protein OC846_003705 [Tilletia horrida]|uniref:Signal recognition particle receptor subunit beta n=1 Tax=Tilletia horrida TaxID=155126 RepID=A0AAN6JXP5_9BASI|nr:hypothetical protein OC846_003705 [Tilletia horrida]KAK0565461.1 hypothetical protein OC861_003759 [Tilletia horrida]
MAFLAPAVRWPDAIQTQLIQWKLVNPESLEFEGSPALIASTVLSILILTTVFTYTFRRTPRGIVSTAQPVSVSNEKGEHVRTKRKQPLSTALVGPQGAGKTALYSTLLYGITPHTQTSQQSSSVTLSISAQEESGSLQEAQKKVNVVLHDLPGHPRLRPLAKHAQIIAGADVILFCIDTVAALGGSAGGAAASAETLTATVDYLHSTLMSLARQRIGASSSGKNKPPVLPPAFAILLTRADLSPLLAGFFAAASPTKKESSDVADNPEAAASAAALGRAKKHQAASAVLLSRARTALEQELRKRRAADVDLASGGGGGFTSTAPGGGSADPLTKKAKAKIGGMGEVARGEGEGSGSGGIVGSILSIFGIGGLLSASRKRGGGVVDEDSGLGGGADGGDDGHLDVADYYLSSGGAGSTFSFDKLDPEVVSEGSIPILLSSVGSRQRGWEQKTVNGSLSDMPALDGLAELKSWIAGPASGA